MATTYKPFEVTHGTDGQKQAIEDGHNIYLWEHDSLRYYVLRRLDGVKEVKYDSFPNDSKIARGPVPYTPRRTRAASSTPQISPAPPMGVPRSDTSSPVSVIRWYPPPMHHRQSPAMLYYVVHPVQRMPLTAPLLDTGTYLLYYPLDCAIWEASCASNAVAEPPHQRWTPGPAYPRVSSELKKRLKELDEQTVAPSNPQRIVIIIDITVYEDGRHSLTYFDHVTAKQWQSLRLSQAQLVHVSHNLHSEVHDHRLTEAQWTDASVVGSHANRTQQDQRSTPWWLLFHVGPKGLPLWHPVRDIDTHKLSLGVQHLVAESHRIEGFGAKIAVACRLAYDETSHHYAFFDVHLPNDKDILQKQGQWHAARQRDKETRSQSFDVHWGSVLAF